MGDGPEKFWMVWGAGRSLPVKQHESYDDALNEAMRLSGKERGTFYVLEAKAYAYPTTPPVAFGQL